MLGILIIAHAPLASSLQAVALHPFPEKEKHIEALDISSSMTSEEMDTLACSLLHKVRNPDALILTDVLGATPYNVAQRLAQNTGERHRVKIIAGVNVPMLWRVLCYGSDALDSMLECALKGAIQGIVASPNLL